MSDIDLTKISDEDLIAYSKQLKNKIQIHNNIQYALKILLNSLFGAVGNEFFIFYNFYGAEAITSTGQYLIQANTKTCNDYINTLTKQHPSTINAIYNDTDSISISLAAVIDMLGVNRDNKGYIDAVCKFADTRLNKQTDTTCKMIGKSLNVIENRLSFKREKVFLSGLYVVKKRYALKVVDEEGVRFTEPKTIVVGLDIKRSDAAMVCRDAMKKTLDLILDHDKEGAQKFIATFEEEFRNMAPEDIAQPTGVNNLKKYSDSNTLFTKGCPIHVRAALVFNNAIKERNLLTKYNYIDEGEQIKFLKLKMPNPVKNSVVAFVDKLPEEFNLLDYIDYAKMYEDTFISGTQKMMECAGWSIQESTDVDDWFD